TASDINIRFNGREAYSMVHVYPPEDIQYVTVNDMELEEFRQQNEKNISESVEFNDRLRIGEYYYVNGVLTGDSLEILLLTNEYSADSH
ncbi:hypothetical protein PENTCL1PPCAC_7592, partial [Pristionchus entomophagus]